MHDKASFIKVDTHHNSVFHHIELHQPTGDFVCLFILFQWTTTLKMAAKNILQKCNAFNCILIYTIVYSIQL